MKQTAIKQAINDIKGYRSFSEMIDIKFVVALLENVYKEKEREQIIDAWNAGFNSQPFKLNNEDSLYYEETYINESV